MSFPIPPTDNLYKFLAITGLLFILAPLVLYWSLELEILQKSFEVRPTMLALEIEGKKIDQDVAEARLGIDQAERAKDLAKMERLRNRYQQAMARFDAHLVKVAEVSAKHDLVSAMLERLRFIVYVAIGGLIIGGVCVIVGFYLWYTKVQVHQDRVLKKDSPAE